MLDIIIKNGTVIVGTEKLMFKADVGIQDDEIREVGNLQNEKAQEIIDAEGHYVTPGFIDIHNHSDSYWTLLDLPTLDSMVMQGVTTIVCGNCGSSLAPLTSGDIINTIQKWADIREANVNWLLLDEFLEQIERQGLSCNFLTLIGHSNLRRGLLGDETKDLTEEEFEVAKKMLAEALDQGAFGISSGLVYAHAFSTKKSELIEFTKVVREDEGLYATHLRNERNNILESIKEAINVAENSDVSLEISHLKIKGEKNWNKMGQVLEEISRARDSGVNLNFDVYPYPASGSTLYTSLPFWIYEGGKKKFLERLKDESIRERIISDIKASSVDYNKQTIAICPSNPALVGRSIEELAKEEGVEIEEEVVNVLLAGRGQVICFDFSISEKNIEKEIKDSISIIGTGGAAYSEENSEKPELVHPRSFGTFPRIFKKYVKEKGILTWEQAVRKMTSMPAQKIGLWDRGFITSNMKADIVILDPDTISDKATFKNPYLYPKGIEHVLVNGKFVVRNGKHTEKLAGKVIRKR